MLLNDKEIKLLAEEFNLISPFVDKQVRELGGTKVISYGLSSYGYDIRVSDKYKIFTNIHSEIVDPKNISEKVFVDHIGDYCLIPPHSFALACSVETFDMPADVTAICLGKSTYARTGLIVNVTPLEAGWSGVLTIELSNTTPLPLKVYSLEGIAQLLFYKGNPCETTYRDKNGKYLNQSNITLAKV